MIKVFQNKNEKKKYMPLAYPPPPITSVNRFHNLLVFGLCLHEEAGCRGPFSHFSCGSVCVSKRGSDVYCFIGTIS